MINDRRCVTCHEILGDEDNEACCSSCIAYYGRTTYNYEDELIRRRELAARGYMPVKLHTLLCKKPIV